MLCFEIFSEGRKEVAHIAKELAASLGMGVARCRLSEREVAALPWLSTLPVGEDCADKLKGFLELPFKAGRSWLVRLSNCVPLYLLGEVLPE